MGGIFSYILLKRLVIQSDARQSCDLRVTNGSIKSSQIGIGELCYHVWSLNCRFLLLVYHQ